MFFIETFNRKNGTSQWNQQDWSSSGHVSLTQTAL